MSLTIYDDGSKRFNPIKNNDGTHGHLDSKPEVKLKSM